MIHSAPTINNITTSILSQGYPEPRIQWLKNDEVIFDETSSTPSTRFAFTKNAMPSNALKNNKNESLNSKKYVYTASMSWKLFRPEDFGIYQFVVHNFKKFALTTFFLYDDVSGMCILINYCCYSR